MFLTPVFAKRINSEKVDGLRPETVAQEIERAQRFLNTVEAIRDSSIASGSKSPWIFGTKNPSALDTSLMVFLVRMMDVKRENLLPQGLREMADLVKMTTEFKETYASL